MGAMLDEIVAEIKADVKKQRPAQAGEPKTKRASKMPSKEEREAYRQKMIEREEARYLGKPEKAKKAEKSEKPKPKPKAKAETRPALEGVRPIKAKPAKPSKKNEKTVSINLPDGGIIVLTYIGAR